MSRRSKLIFLFLVVAQAAHSLEEYVTRLFEVFGPARLVSGLVAENLAVGFAVLNAAFIVVGIWCYVGPVRTGGRAGWFVAVISVAIELANGTGHLAIAAFNGGYFSGALTAVLLVATGASLAVSLVGDKRRGGHGVSPEVA
ncbi:MAG TPA: HXXEE domain-containing protein [Gammaproteobacteria bacterium]|nr:HXXEE domain-containing protein [Gammaproteobacteria bacterium]